MTRRKKHILLLVLGIALGLAITAWKSRRDNEPAYAGKTLTEWLLQAYENSSPEESNAAAQAAIRHIGTNAIPFLIEHLEKQPSAHQQWFHDLIHAAPAPIQNLPAIHRHEWRAGYKEPWGKYSGFRILGQIAAPAIPELQRIMFATNTPTSVSRDAMLAILDIDKERAFPILTNAISNPQFCYRPLAVYSLFRMRRLGQTNNPAVTVLLDCLQSDETEIAENAALALGILQLDSERVIPKLEQSLHSDRTKVRCKTLEALAKFGPAARPVLPSILPLLTNNSQNIQSAASKALLAIAPESVNSP